MSIAEAEGGSRCGYEYESYVVHNTSYMITSFDGLYNIGVDILDEACYLEHRYQCVYYALPEANDVNVLNLNPYCLCQKPNIGEYANYPQDITIGYIYDWTTESWDWKAFVINTASNKLMRINNLLTVPNPSLPYMPDILGKTPVDSEIRSNYDKLYIANTNSKGSEYDISILPYLDEWPPKFPFHGITEISDDFHPKAIAIQLVLKPSNFIELARADLEQMEDSDFTTPSKRQVLLNRIDVIENLIKKDANKQAIIANIEAFQRQTNEFVINEARKEEILGYSEALVQSIIE